MTDTKKTLFSSMKNLYKIMVLLAISISIVACTNSNNQKAPETNTQTYHKLDMAGWLIGKWQNKSAEGNINEIWVIENDSTYTGKSYFIAGKDTVTSERISLTQIDEELFYIPTVKDQNDGQSVRFRMTSISNDQLVFENPEHDFPQKISYTKISTDYLLAEISGTMNGKERSEQFPMRKEK